MVMCLQKILLFWTSAKLLKLPVDEARPILQRGGVLAYPTEAVYGLGCDAFNQTAVESIHSLKGRDSNKGFIVLIADWSQLPALIGSITEEQHACVRATWPGFVTWIFPAAAALPRWITGDQNTIAIRMSAHPIAHALAMASPLISTSANLSGQPPAITAEQILQQFPTGIDAIVEGALGSFSKPSEIYDVQSGLRLR